MINFHAYLLVVSIAQLAILILAMRELYSIQQLIVRPLATAEKFVDSAKNQAERFVDTAKEAGAPAREFIDKLANHVKKLTKPRSPEL